jgi:hypothetical protein
MRDAIEWDLYTYRGWRLKDLYQGRVTLREYAVFISGLPKQSRLVSAIRPYRDPIDIEDLPADAWEMSDHLLANIADKLEKLYWIQLSNDSRPSEPSWTPRPGMSQRDSGKKRGLSAWFSGLGVPTEE